MTEKTIHDIMTKTDWKDESVHKTCVAIRKYKKGSNGCSSIFNKDFIKSLMIILLALVLF